MRIFSVIVLLFVLSLAVEVGAQDEDRGWGVTFSASQGVMIQNETVGTRESLRVVRGDANYDFGLVRDHRDVGRGYVDYLTVFRQIKEDGSRGGVRAARYYPIMKRTALHDVGLEPIVGWSRHRGSNRLEYGGGLRIRTHTQSGTIEFAGQFTKDMPLYGQVRFTFFSQ